MFAFPLFPSFLSFLLTQHSFLIALLLPSNCGPAPSLKPIIHHHFTPNIMWVKCTSYTTQSHPTYRWLLAQDVSPLVLCLLWSHQSSTSKPTPRHAEGSPGHLAEFSNGRRRPDTGVYAGPFLICKKLLSFSWLWDIACPEEFTGWSR